MVKKVMSKEAVGRCLDNLLVELEVTKNPEVEKKFTETYNNYCKVYNLQEYVEKLAKIRLW